MKRHFFKLFLIIPFSSLLLQTQSFARDEAPTSDIRETASFLGRKIEQALQEQQGISASLERGQLREEPDQEEKQEASAKAEQAIATLKNSKIEGLLGVVGKVTRKLEAMQGAHTDDMRALEEVASRILARQGAFEQLKQFALEPAKGAQQKLEQDTAALREQTQEVFAQFKTMQEAIDSVKEAEQSDDGLKTVRVVTDADGIYTK